jgi:hypothetical protein
VDLRSLGRGGSARPVTVQGMHSSGTRAAAYWALNRVRDISGISGTGYVAYVMEMTDGSAVMVWDTAWATVDFRPSMDAVRALHGHEGATLVEAIAPDSPQAQRARELLNERSLDVVSTLSALLQELTSRPPVAVQ